MITEQNPWWKYKEAIESDYDIEKFKEKKHKWVPELNMQFQPFSLHFLLGPRQVGKTTLVKLTIRELLKKRDPKSIFYFNCENLADYKELTDIIESYLDFKSMYDITESIIFLDEVTSAKEWYKAIKFLIDTGRLKNDVLLLTGSSSISIKKNIELFPGRRGKGKDFLLMPLSFREFVKVLKPELHVDAAKSLDELKAKAGKAMLYKKELDSLLAKYMDYGGFPLGIEAISGSKEDAKRTYLAWIKNSVLKSDRDDIIARQIVKAVLERMPSPISWEKISKEIEIKSPKTVSAYINLMQSMFALIIAYSVDISSKKIKFGKNKKIHFIDPLLLETFEDWCMVEVKNKKSIIAESLVAAHLARAYQAFFWKNGFEIDSLVLHNNSFYGFEVKWSERSDSKTLPQLKSLIIVTKDELGTNKIPLSIFLMLLDFKPIESFK